jgi:DNA-binding NarL/FixJ family response regulator
MPTFAPPIRLALIEDDPEVREGLQVMLKFSGRFDFVLAAPSAEEALEQLPGLNPDVVLVDIHLPGMSGIDCIRILKGQMPRVQIMMLTVFEDHDRIFQSLSAGASGYLLKQTPPDKLREAICELHAGGSPMSASIARRMVETFRAPSPSRSQDELDSLSPRESQTLALLAKGFLYKEIADQMSVSVETVRTHLQNIYAKLHVRSRTEAVMKAYGPGSVASDPRSRGRI